MKAKYLILTVILAVLLLSHVISAYGLPERPSVYDVDGYSVELYVYDNNTGGPITTNTNTIRRVYSINNTGKNKIKIQCFGVNGFAMRNMTTGEHLDTGGSGNMHLDITVPPHSRQIVAFDDITSLQPPPAGQYRCMSGCTIWYKLPPDSDYVYIMPETIVSVKDEDENNVLSAINDVNTNIMNTQNCINARMDRHESNLNRIGSRIYNYCAKIYEYVARIYNVVIKLKR